MQVLKSFDCPPAGVNGAASALTRGANPGQRVGSLSNVDCSGRRIVKRGAVVEFPGGATARVSRVRLGVFVTDVPCISPGDTRAFHSGHRCCAVKVVAA